MHRVAEIALSRASDSPDASDERIAIALSSETPVERWFGNEILDHSAGAIDLTRAEGGLPLLLDHDGADQIGIIEGIEIGSDRVLRGMMRFSKSPRAQEIRQDVLDGIRRSASIGYRVREMVLEERHDAGETYRVTRWDLLEGSLVAVPADTSVGVGRSAAEPAFPVVVRSTKPAPAAKERSVDEKDTAAQNGAAPAVTVGQDREAAQNQVRQLAELAKMHKLESELARWVMEGKTVEQAKDEILERARQGAAMITKPVIDLNEKEQRQYSVCRAILAHANKDWGAAGFEREISEEIEKKLPQTYQRHGGFFMPTKLGQRTALAAGTANAAADVVFTQPAAFIALLRKAMKVRQLGATVLSGLNGPVAFPRQTGAGSVQWLGESGQVTESNLTTDQVALAPKTIRARQSFTKQLLAQGVLDVENMVRSDLANILALGIDLAAINGSGAASNEPTGILNTAGIGSVAIGADGGAPTYSSIVDLETEIAIDDADIDAMAYLTTPVMRGKLKKTEQFATTNGQPVWTGGKEGEMNGYAAHVSNQVPSNLTKGTSTDCHAILFGVWSQLVLGEWGVLELQADPFTRGDYGEIVVRAFQMVGIAVRHPEAFAAIKDARNV